MTCRECGRPAPADRGAARRAGWEPWSTSTQAAMDHGPMVCPDCVMAIIEGALAAYRNLARRG